MRNWQMSNLAIGVLMALCSAAAQAQEATDAPLPVVPSLGQTQPTATGQTNDAVLARNTAQPTQSHVIATAALGGLEVYSLSGKRLGSTAAGEVASVAVADDQQLGGRRVTVVAAIDTTGNFLRLFTQSGSKLTEVGARPLPLGFAA